MYSRIAATLVGLLGLSTGCGGGGGGGGDGARPCTLSTTGSVMVSDKYCGDAQARMVDAQSQMLLNTDETGFDFQAALFFPGTPEVKTYLLDEVDAHIIVVEGSNMFDSTQNLQGTLEVTDVERVPRSPVDLLHGRLEATLQNVFDATTVDVLATF